MRPATKKHTVSVFGIDLPVVNNHRKTADRLAAELQNQTRDMFEVEFVDIIGGGAKRYPDAMPSIFGSQLPLVLLDGEVRFNGNVTAKEIIDAIKPTQGHFFPPFFPPKRQRMLPK